MFKNLIFSIFISVIVCAAFSYSVNAQQRDNLTYEEIELIRDMQSIDGRMEIFIKAIDRRLMVLKNTTALHAKEIEKDSEKWGALPKGTRAELLSDIRKILDEAIDKIDDVSDQDAKNDLLPYSLHLLADGAKRFIPELQQLKDTTTDPRESGLLGNSLESCQEILDAAAKIARPEKKPKPKKN